MVIVQLGHKNKGTFEFLSEIRIYASAPVSRVSYRG